MAKLYNLARMTTATTGAGTITLGSAVSGFLSFAGAGAANGDVVSYGILDGANSEVGTGTYTAIWNDAHAHRHQVDQQQHRNQSVRRGASVHHRARRGLRCSDSAARKS